MSEARLHERQDTLAFSTARGGDGFRSQNNHIRPHITLSEQRRGASRARVIFRWIYLMTTGLLAFNGAFAQNCSNSAFADSHEYLENNTDNIYFATNRNLSGTSFGNDIGLPSFGYSQALFTELPRVGFFDGMENALDVKTGRLIPLTEDEMIEDISRLANLGRPFDPMRPTDSVLVYIHGFANDFHHALCRASEIKHRARFEGSLILFSWPASDTIEFNNLQGLWNAIHVNNEYEHDSATANDERTVSTLVEFLQKLRKRVPASRTVLVAHSMGNQLLLKAVQNMAIQPEDRYRAIVMLAPDVGVSTLQASLPTLSTDAKRSVLYVNKEDKALWVSAQKNKEERAGRVDLLDPNGYMETVDITQATHGAGGMHHADHLETTALYDLFWNIVRDQPAECREERGISVKKGAMWEIQPSDTTYDVAALRPQCRLINPQQGH